jgi:predicted patatin/cPLA2 family phospholipase
MINVKKKPVPLKKINPLEVSLAFAGGGCKTLYGMGFGSIIRKKKIHIKEISGVSAGAATVLGIVSESEEETIEYLSELTRRNSSNFQFLSLFQGNSPFPHENIYRRLIRHGLDMEKVKKSKIKISILAVKGFPKKKEFVQDLWMKTKLVTKTTRAYLLDEIDKSKGLPCGRVTKIMEQWNMEEVIYTNKDLKSPEIVETIILNSSSIPPVISFQNQNSIYFLDGGLTNNLLIENFSKRSKIIGIYYEDTTIFGKDRKLLEKCLLVKPSRPIPLSSFDYTNPEGVKECYELGKADALRLLPTIIDFCKGK